MEFRGEIDDHAGQAVLDALWFVESMVYHVRKKTLGITNMICEQKPLSWAKSGVATNKREGSCPATVTLVEPSSHFFSFCSCTVIACMVCMLLWLIVGVCSPYRSHNPDIVMLAYAMFKYGKECTGTPRRLNGNGIVYSPCPRKLRAVNARRNIFDDSYSEDLTSSLPSTLMLT
ncbi:unnamed protein product [Orchesella dallaii]|uniref:Uncharacterized protein n=1 Tax=Orchesella dallaii TaxID=48710 RepID=A0ABP1Q1W4_9HEXA